MYGPYLDQDMNKQLVVTRQGNVNTDWVPDHSMELLILLGMVLGLCFS